MPKTAREPLVESVTFTSGVLAEVSNEETGEVLIDVLFPSPDGTKRELRHMLADIAERLAQKGQYADVRVTIDVRDGGQLFDGLLPGYGG